MAINEVEIEKLGKEFNILWDFDGTICDTYPIIGQVFVDYAAEHGVSLKIEKILPFLKTHLSDVSYLHFGIPKPTGGTFEHEKRYWNRIPAPIFKGVPEAMTIGNNYLVSNRSSQSIEEMLTRQGVGFNFNDVITAFGEMDYPRKPDPFMYRELARRHGDVNLVIGDRDVDMIPAREIGWKTCSFRSRKIETDYYLSNYWEFPGIYLASIFDIIIPRKRTPLSPEFMAEVLADNPKRLAHLLATAEKCSSRELGLLHDIGYAPRFRRTGYHPIDGALAAMELGYTDYRLILPILFHSYSAERAKLEGIPEIAAFYDRIKPFRRIRGIKRHLNSITYADLTTGPAGETMTLQERIDDIRSRYPEQHPAYRSIVENISNRS